MYNVTFQYVSIWKVINNVFYILLQSDVFRMWCIFFTWRISQLILAGVQVLTSHVWPLATILDSDVQSPVEPFDNYSYG